MLTGQERNVRRIIKRHAKKASIIAEDRGDGVYIDGVYKRGELIESEQFKQLAIFPLSEKHIKDLEEGQREEDSRQFFTCDYIKNKDRVIVNGEIFTVNGIKVWPSHTEGVLLRSGEADNKVEV